MLAGLTEPDSGYIEVEGEVWLDSSRRINLPTRRRSIGFVFQDFALFPNLTVRQQLEYALPDPRKPAIIKELLAFMELEALQHHRPGLLSGGQQQRVALARAIARGPRLLLLDEPLSALDDDMRHRLQEYIQTAHRHYGLTTMLVSHHLPEVFRLADEAIFLEKGRIVGQGDPAAVFAERPLSYRPGSVDMTGEILNITADGEQLAVTILVRGAGNDRTIELEAAGSVAAGWRVGQTITITITPKIS